MAPFAKLLSAFGVGLLTGCAAMPPGAPGYAGPPVALPNIGFGGMLAPLNPMVQQAQAYQRQQAQAARAEAERDARPHIESAIYAGALAPVDDVAALVSGQTLFLQTPIVASRQLVRMDEKALYLAANGRSFTSAWADQPWHVEGNAVCIATGGPPTCMPVFRDAEGSMFMGGPNHKLVKLARMAPGDAAGVKAQFAENQRTKARRDAAMAEFAGMLMQGIMSGGGGSGGGSRTAASKPEFDDGMYMRQQQEYSRMYGPK